MRRHQRIQAVIVLACLFCAIALSLSACTQKVVASGPSTTTTIGIPVPPGCAQDSGTRLKAARDQFDSLQANYESQLQSAMGPRSSLPTDQASLRGIAGVVSSVQKSSAAGLRAYTCWPSNGQVQISALADARDLAGEQFLLLSQAVSASAETISQLRSAASAADRTQQAALATARAALANSR